MAAFYPFDPEGYGGLDRDAPTTLETLDLGGRQAGDVLTSMLYTGPDGSVHPALGRGCDPRQATPINEAKLRALRDPAGIFSLAVDPKAAARSALRERQAELAAGGPVKEDARVLLAPKPRPRYTSRTVIPRVTQCECKSLQDRARVRGSLKGTHMDEYSRYERDLHANDDRWFSDGDRILYEFFELANASTLTIALVRAGVLEPPQFPLRVLAGRTAPCACSLLGPQLVHRAYQFFADDLERVFIDRYNPRDRSMGAVLARLNKRVTEHFAADQAQWALQDGDEARVRAMARNAETGAGSWQYEPLAAHLPSSGRANPQPATSLDHYATAHHRLAAEKIAARYGYGITPDGQIASY
jgi:hypothetical protein